MARNPLVVALDVIGSWFILVVVLISSLVINSLQALAWLCVFLPRRTRLWFCQLLSNTWWELFCFTQEVWCHIPFRFTGDKIRDGEVSVLIGNHERGLDFATGVSVIARAVNIGCGRMMAMMKYSLQFLPTIGWTMSLQGSLFLKRNWEKDQALINSKLADMENGTFPRPFWIGIYPEGTRITPKKHAESLKFAQERGLPLLNNVLLPRTKGFIYLVKHLPTSIEAIYDVTIGYGTSPFYLGHILFGGRYKSDSVHVHVQRFNWKDLPKPEAELEKWLMDRFVKKDQLLDHFKQHGFFPGEHRKEHECNVGRFTFAFNCWAIVSSLLLFLATSKLAVLTACLGCVSYISAKALFVAHPASVNVRAKPDRAALKAKAAAAGGSNADGASSPKSKDA